MTRKQSRNFDLVKECRRLIDRNGPTPISAEKIAKEIARGPAPRYYIEYDYALRVLSQLSRGVKIEWKSPYVEKQWQSLLDDVNRVRHRYHYSMGYALAKVLAEYPAPSYFISPSTIYRVITASDPLNA